MQDVEHDGPCVAVAMTMAHGVSVFEWPNTVAAHRGMQGDYGFEEHDYYIHVLDPEPLGVAFLTQ